MKKKDPPRKQTKAPGMPADIERLFQKLQINARGPLSDEDKRQVMQAIVKIVDEIDAEERDDSGH